MPDKKHSHSDYQLLIVVIFLLLFGIALLASVSAVFSQVKFGRTTYYLFHQLTYGVLSGILFGFIAFKISLSFLRKWAWFFILINLILMALVFVPKIGIVSGGAHRWLNFGFSTFQPSEFLKLAFIIYISAWLASRTEKSSLKNEKKKLSWKTTLIAFLVILSLVALLLIFQSDLSTLMIILSAAFVVYFLADTPFWHSIFMFFAGIAGAIVLIVVEPYRLNRVKVLLQPLFDPTGLGYQLKQALIAVGSGGIFGVGLGMSNQKFGFLPQMMSDSVFAIFAEEMGLIGSLVLIILFLWFLWRGFSIAKKSQDKFSRLFAVGFTFWICIQAFVNMGAMTGIIPLTGIPLPFISYGGSHIVAELIGVGLLLNISKSVRK